MSHTDYTHAYEGLAPPARELLDTKMLSAQMTADEWLECLVPLERLDEQVDVEAAYWRKRAGRFWIWFGVTLFLGIFVIAFGGAAGGGAVAGIAAAIIVALLVMFGFGGAHNGRRRKAVERFDTPNSMRLTVRPVVTLLREDVAKSTPISLAIDLRPSETPETLVHRTPPHERPPWRKLTEEFFDRRLLYAEAKLADGARLQLTLYERVRKRSGTKRGSSGKIKHKTKRAKWLGIEAIIRMPANVYAVTAGHPIGPAGRVAVKPGERRHTVRVRRKSKTLDLEATLASEHVFDAIAEAYRRSTAASGGGGGPA